MRNVRGIAVVDIGKTNSKIALFSPSGEMLAQRKLANTLNSGPPYKFLNPEPALDLCREALPELDQIVPIDVVVPCSHGASITCVDMDGRLSVPVMDYTEEPPPDIVAAYRAIEPGFEESGTPHLPIALLQGLQLYMESRVLPEAFSNTAAIVPWAQYFAFRLGGELVTEISSMSCQSHLVDVRNDTPSSFIRHMGWQHLFPRRAKAWEEIGTLKPEYRGGNFRGRGSIVAGVHDSSANHLRYLAAGRTKFTLVSTGTWIIGFDSEATLADLNPEKDTVTNTSVLGKLVICFRFFGGYEYDALTAKLPGGIPRLELVEGILASDTFALPSFSDAGGPVPNTGNKGKIIGRIPETADERATLASLYCALMVSESLKAISARHDVIIDGPFSTNPVFLAALAALHPNQKILASDLRDGTTAGAACLGLMDSVELPFIDLHLTQCKPMIHAGFEAYANRWQQLAYASSV